MRINTNSAPTIFDRGAEYSRALVNVQQKVVQIISGITTKVLLENGGPSSIGWTDGETIWIDADKAKSKFVKALESQDRGQLKQTIASISAVAKHELAHLMYSPRWDHPIYAEMRKRGPAHKYHYAMNLLEDQRIETLFTKKFPIASGYFTLMVTEWVVNAKNDTVATSWPFVAGRWYLPVELRKMIKNAFAVQCGDVVADQIADITAEYRKLDVAGTTSQAELQRIADLIVRFHELLEMTISIGPSNPGPIGDDTPQDGVQSGQAQDASTEADQAADDDGGMQGTGKSDDGAGSNADADGVSDKNGFGDSEPGGQNGAGSASGDDTGQGNPGDGDSPGDGSGDASGAPGESQDGGSGQGNGGAAGGSSGGAGPTPRQIKKTAKEIAEDELSDSQTAKEIEAITDAVDTMVAEGNSGFSNVPPAFVKLEIRPNANAKAQRSAIAAALRNLRNDLSPQWERRQNRGSRIDMRTLLDSKAKQIPTIEMFRRNVMHGDEAVHMDVVLMIDISGSMISEIRETMMTAWAIKGALADCDVRTGIAAYDTNVSMISRPDDAFDLVAIPSCTGGTEPSRALEAVSQHFHRAKAKQPVLIILTDGEWNTPAGWRVGVPTYAEQEIAKLNAQGVTTVLAGLAGAVQKHGTHGCTLAADLHGPRAMAQLTERVVATLMAQQRH